MCLDGLSELDLLGVAAFGIKFCSETAEILRLFTLLVALSCRAFPTALLMVEPAPMLLDSSLDVLVLRLENRVFGLVLD